MRFRTVLEAIGAALLLLPWYLQLLDPTNIPLYHYGLPVTNLIGGLLIDLMCVAILTLGFLGTVQYLPKAPQKFVDALFAGFMLWRITNFACLVFYNLPYQVAKWNRVRIMCCITFLLLSVIITSFLPRVAQRATRAVHVVIAALALSALWIIPKILQIAFVQQVDVAEAPENLPASISSTSGPRIVWVLFDELSYDQTFDRPALDVPLSNFDRLRTESVSFSQLRPAGYFTDRIIPSLFLGRRIDRIRSTDRGDLWYKDESQDRWLRYDPNASLFALAQQNGWITGVDGWYNPYCHTFAPVLDVCFRERYTQVPLVPTELNGASEQQSVWADAAAAPEELLARLTGKTIKRANLHEQEYENIMARSRALIKDEQVRFLFIHLPIPHPPAIYDRRRHMLRSGGSYLDNLVLADDTLGSLLQEINATQSTSRTTLIISSDHSWRIALYRGTEDWSAEDEHASGNRFDDRPVLLVHFPGQTSGRNVDSSVPELLEHDMVAGMLQGKINSPDDLSAFLSQQGH
jgi:hypothetical protein